MAPIAHVGHINSPIKVLAKYSKTIDVSLRLSSVSGSAKSVKKIVQTPGLYT